MQSQNDNPKKNRVKRLHVAFVSENTECERSKAVCLPENIWGFVTTRPLVVIEVRVLKRVNSLHASNRLKFTQ